MVVKILTYYLKTNELFKLLQKAIIERIDNISDDQGVSDEPLTTDQLLEGKHKKTLNYTILQQYRYFIAGIKTAIKVPYYFDDLKQEIAIHLAKVNDIKP